MDQPTTTRRQPPPPLTRMADRFEITRHQAEADIYNVYHELSARLDQIEAVLAKVETAALITSLPQQDDRLTIAEVCRRLDMPWDYLAKRSPDPRRGRAVAEIFRALREIGWSHYRIAKASGYTPRGVTSNLAKYRE